MRKACGILSLVIIGVMLACIFWGSPLAVGAMERDTKDYLSEAGFAPGDIVSIKGQYDRFAEKEKKYFVEVVLQNAPEEVLIFRYDQAGHIQPSGG